MDGVWDLSLGAFCTKLGNCASPDMISLRKGIYPLINVITAMYVWRSTSRDLCLKISCANNT